MGWLLQFPTSGLTDTSFDLLNSQLWDLGTTGVWETTDAVVAGFDSEQAADRAAEIVRHRFDAVSVTTAVDVMSGPSDETGKPQVTTVEVHAVDGRTVRFPIIAGPTFGHGKHQTTRLALDQLGAIVEPGMSVLDVGTGSGVLAIAAALLGAVDVHARDIDPEAVETALANAKECGVTIHCSTASTTETAAENPSRFDVIVVNLLLPIHRQVAADIVSMVAPGGQVATSGYLTTQADEVAAAYGPLTAVSREQIDDWVGQVHNR